MARVVVVSGGGTGIGRAVARSFARDGEQVVLVGRRQDTLTRAVAGLAADVPQAPAGLAVAADLAEPDEAARVRDQIVERFGTVDVLVNTAGGNVLFAGVAGDGLERVHAHWVGNFRANVLTAVLLTEALRDSLAAPGGRVVLVSSIAAYRGSGSGSYGAAKAALHPYAFDLSAAMAGRGITVNVVAPGYVTDTEFFGASGLPKARHELLVGQTHTGRASTPEDVAATVRWLASPESAQITAQIIQVNGGAERGR